MSSAASFLPSSQSLQMIYHALTAAGRAKDKGDMILEPLQAMIQLALLSTCSIGTKLHIQENILFLQPPTMIQPVSRWYHADKKDDLYFLYSVIKRFIKWYHPSNNAHSPVWLELYQLIRTMSMDGMTHLMRTYSSAESNTVIHVIQMYRNLLEFNNDKILSDEYMTDAEKGKISVDEVFEKIVQIYDPTVLHVVFHSLTMIRDEPDPSSQQTMVEGLNHMLQKSNRLIRDWIKLNLAL